MIWTNARSVQLDCSNGNERVSTRRSDSVARWNPNALECAREGASNRMGGMGGWEQAVGRQLVTVCMRLVWWLAWWLEASVSGW
jgi:hypothetical protein